MTQQEPEKHLIPKSPQEVLDNSEMSLQDARTILASIVGHHESNITSSTTPDMIGEYSLDQVRNAVCIVALDLVKDVQKESLGVKRIHKMTSRGELTFGFFRKIKDFKITDPEYVELELIDHGRIILNNSFALAEPENSFYRTFISFIDHRSRSRKYTNLYSFYDNPSLEGYQHLMRGLRWMCANLLDWNNSEVIMPEALDTPMLKSTD